MKAIWRLLNSRKFAIYLLLVITLLLTVSAFFPNEFTLTAEELERFEEENPILYRLSFYLTTPGIVRNPIFIGINIFLFLSTLACTISRLLSWYRRRAIEFEKDKAFSFSLTLQSQAEGLRERILKTLKERKWRIESHSDEIITAERGKEIGFWGSVVFHLGLVICFLSAPVTALTVFRGIITVPEDEIVDLDRELKVIDGTTPSALRGVSLEAISIDGVFQNDVGVEFQSKLRLFKGDSSNEIAPAVNKPSKYKGIQIGINEFGYSTRIVIENGTEPVFDYFLNLKSLKKGNKFLIVSEGLTLWAVFFPDFVKEGSKMWSRSKADENPILFLRLLRGEEEVFKGLLSPGDTAQAGVYKVSFPEYKNWGGFIFVKEAGLGVIWVGFLVGAIGLFVRFLSNERRVEAVFTKNGLELKGYSRYYPAFLEREINEMAGGFKDDIS